MNLENLMSQNYSSLNENDLLIWKYISEHKIRCSNISIDELASSCNVSRTTITRFARKIGLDGFSEMKVMLRWELKHETIQSINLEDLFSSYHHIINDIKRIDCSNLCRQIKKAHNLYVFGTGAMQMAIARHLQVMYLNTHLNFFVIEDYDELQQVIPLMGKDDVIFIISISGSSNSLMEVLPHLKVMQPYIVSFTKQKENELAKMSDESFYIPMNRLNFKYLEDAYETMSWGFTMLMEVILVKYQLYLEGIEYSD